jgi:hypothetical protein
MDDPRPTSAPASRWLRDSSSNPIRPRPIKSTQHVELKATRDTEEEGGWDIFHTTFMSTSQGANQANETNEPVTVEAFRNDFSAPHYMLLPNDDSAPPVICDVMIQEKLFRGVTAGLLGELCCLCFLLVEGGTFITSISTGRLCQLLFRLATWHQSSWQFASDLSTKLYALCDVLFPLGVLATHVSSPGPAEDLAQWLAKLCEVPQVVLCYFLLAGAIQCLHPNRNPVRYMISAIHMALVAACLLILWSSTGENRLCITLALHTYPPFLVGFFCARSALNLLQTVQSANITPHLYFQIKQLRASNEQLTEENGMLIMERRNVLIAQHLTRNLDAITQGGTAPTGRRSRHGSRHGSRQGSPASHRGSRTSSRTRATIELSPRQSRTANGIVTHQHGSGQSPSGQYWFGQRVVDSPGQRAGSSTFAIPVGEEGTRVAEPVVSELVTAVVAEPIGTSVAPDAAPATEIPIGLIHPPFPAIAERRSAIAGSLPAELTGAASPAPSTAEQVPISLHAQDLADGEAAAPRASLTIPMGIGGPSPRLPVGYYVPRGTPLRESPNGGLMPNVAQIIADLPVQRPDSSSSYEMSWSSCDDEELTFLNAGLGDDLLGL